MRHMSFFFIVIIIANFTAFVVAMRRANKEADVAYEKLMQRSASVAKASGDTVNGEQ
jgi:hypothetical protein